MASFFFSSICANFIDPYRIGEGHDHGILLGNSRIFWGIFPMDVLLTLESLEFLEFGKGGRLDYWLGLGQHLTIA